MVFNGIGPRNHHFERAMANARNVSAWVTEHCVRDALTPGGVGAQIHELATAEGYSTDDANRIVRSLLSAGIDTTVYGIGNAVYCLAQHPQQWSRLRADPSLARSAFEETVRFESPAQAFFRTTTLDVEIEGKSIPSGTKVLLFVGAANRDPRRWDEPNRFDICRNALGNLGFGAGIHVWQMLARQGGADGVGRTRRHNPDQRTGRAPAEQRRARIEIAARDSNVSVNRSLAFTPIRARRRVAKVLHDRSTG